MKTLKDKKMKTIKAQNKKTPSSQNTTKRKQAEDQGDDLLALLNSISHAQSLFITDTEPRVLFDKLLRDLLLITKSQYGFIGEVLYTAKGKPYLKNHAITNISWNKKTREFYKKNAPKGMEFYNLKTLFGAVMTTGKPVISNNPSTDPRSGGLPKGHPTINTFLGIPFCRDEKLVGMVGIANRPGGYDKRLVKYLRPLLTTCRNIIEAYRIDQMRKMTEEALWKSEEEFRRAFENANDAIFWADTKTGLITHCNKAAEALLEKKREEIIGRHQRTLHPPQKSKYYTKMFKKHIEQKNAINDEAEVITKSGKIKPVHITASLILIGEKQIIQGIFRDITERKRIEEILLKEKNFSESMINSLPGIFYLFDDKGKFLRWNKNLEKVTGYSSEDISKMSPLDFFAGEDKKIIAEKIQEVFVKGESTAQANLASKNGEKTPYFFTGLRITIDNNVPYITGMGIDITEHQEMEKLWEDTFNTITDMITIHDKDFNIIRANKSAKKILGLPSLEVTKVKCYEYYHGKDCPPEGCPSCESLKTGTPAAFEIFEPYLNMFLEIRAMPRFDSNNQLIGLIHIVRDITERKKIEEEHNKLIDAVTKAKVEWEMTFDSVMELIMLVDKELNIIRCNKSFAEFAGKPVNELVGRKYHEFFPCDQKWIDFKGYIQTEKPMEKTEVKTEPGHWFYVSHRPIWDKKGGYLYTVIIATDITEPKNTQQRLLESEKELKKRVDELEKFYSMAVGRELRMKKLKSEIEKLNAELSQYKKDDLNRR